MPATYELLPRDDTPVEPTDEPGHPVHAAHAPRNWSMLEAGFTSLLVILLLACTVSNAMFIYQAKYPTLKESKTISQLRRPTTYMGLGNLQWSSTDGTAQNFSNFPFLLTQISAKAPTRVWPDDASRRMTDIGTVSPDGRTFKVSPDVSSVLQFRTVDFGYERCTIEIALNDPKSKSMSMDVSHPTKPVAVDVWRLDTSSQAKLDVKQLSWSTRPPRSSRLGTLFPEWGHVIILESSFPCPWGTYQTLEISCAEDMGGDVSACEMAFWQDPKIPQLGVTMKQMSSLAS